eukprot:7382231-Prymnesium_polylepis.1
MVLAVELWRESAVAHAIPRHLRAPELPNHFWPARDGVAPAAPIVVGTNEPHVVLARHACSVVRSELDAGESVPVILCEGEEGLCRRAIESVQHLVLPAKAEAGRVTHAPLDGRRDVGVDLHHQHLRSESSEQQRLQNVGVERVD